MCRTIALNELVTQVNRVEYLYLNLQTCSYLLYLLICAAMNTTIIFELALGILKDDKLFFSSNLWKNT